MGKDHYLQMVTYAMQWLAFTLSSIIIVPVVVGFHLGLDTQQIAAFIQRTFFFTGVFSFVQVKWGHRVPIVEGPGGMWYSLFIIVAVFYPQIGKPLGELRSDLVAGLLLTGIMYLILVVSGLYNKIRPLFTPMVNGTFLILMPLSLSATVIRGILGIGGFHWQGVLAALAAVVVIVFVSLKAQGFLQSISVLCGLGAGWLAAVVLGVGMPSFSGHSIISFPEFLPWGRPTLDYGIAVSCVITGFLIMSNHVASTFNVYALQGKEAADKEYNRGLVVTGLANIGAALWGLLGFIPFASTIGFLKLTGMIWKKPYMLFSLFLVVFSLFPVVGGLLASIPAQVGYAVLLVVLCQVMGSGIQEYARLSLNNKEVFTCGFSLLIGVGVMFLPLETFVFLDPALRIILGNGLIMGLLVCILLERVLR